MLLATPLVHAFNADGHKLVVQLATFQFSEPVQQRLEQLYGERWRSELVYFADWALEARPEPALRTVFFDPDDRFFEPARHCPDNSCVVGALQESLFVLRGTGFTPGERRQALQYLIHFITDIHIPVNAGRRADQGGEMISLIASDLERISLHQAWTERLYPLMPDDWFTQAQRLRRLLPGLPVEEWGQYVEPAIWAMETHALALETAYPWAERRRWDAIYQRQALAVLEEQLLKASVRLAATLEFVWALEMEEGLQ